MRRFCRIGLGASIVIGAVAVILLWRSQSRALGGGGQVGKFAAQERSMTEERKPCATPPDWKGERVLPRIRGTAGTQSAQTSTGAERAVRTRLLDELIRAWNALPADNGGQALLAKQVELAGDALKLGASEEFLSFLGFLKAKGANDVREHILTLAGGRFFNGSAAGEARRWLASLESGPMKQKLSDHAGRHLPETDLGEFLDLLRPDTECQRAALAGYCRTLASTDPSGAVKTYIETIPTFATSFSGIEGIMMALPPTADFAGISSTLPDDSKAIARRARSALLQSWAATKPEDAAQYVISNTTVTRPEQMAVVIAKWAASRPDRAAEWLAALAPGTPRDEGMAAMSNHWTRDGEPANAWQCAAQVGDPKRRIEAATAVFHEWEKKDHDAAVKAWEELFPPAR